MGLSKQIEIGGVPTAYHRIASVNIITNQANLIEVHSYVSQEKREIEKEAIENRHGFDVLVQSNSYVAPYDQEMTVDSAYSYIKALDDFSGATDVLEV